jgi:SOS-response transcriptional repressor LexA
MDGLTPLQARCLGIIIRFIEEHRLPPTRKELAEISEEKSTNGVNQRLVQLQKKGYIKISSPRKKRNIVVLKGPETQLGLFNDRNP